MKDKKDFDNRNKWGYSDRMMIERVWWNRKKGNKL